MDLCPTRVGATWGHRRSSAGVVGEIAASGGLRLSSRRVFEPQPLSTLSWQDDGDDDARQIQGIMGPGPIIFCFSATSNTLLQSCSGLGEEACGKIIGGGHKRVVSEHMSARHRGDRSIDASTDEDRHAA